MSGRLKKILFFNTIAKIDIFSHRLFVCTLICGIFLIPDATVSTRTTAQDIALTEETTHKEVNSESPTTSKPDLIETSNHTQGDISTTDYRTTARDVALTKETTHEGVSSESQTTSKPDLIESSTHIQGDISTTDYRTTAQDIALTEETTLEEINSERPTTSKPDLIESSTQGDISTKDYAKNVSTEENSHEEVNSESPTTSIPDLIESSTQGDISTTDYTKNESPEETSHEEVNSESPTTSKPDLIESSTQSDIGTTDYAKNESEISGQDHKESSLISKEIYDTFKAIIWLGFVPTFALAGIAGNVLGVWFVWHRKLKQSFMIYLMALMITDLIYLIMELLTSSFVIMERYNLPIASYYNCYVSRYFTIVKEILYSTCVFLITTMSVERLLNIVFPLKIKFCGLQKYTALTVLTIVCVNFVLMMLPFFLVKPNITTDSEGNLLSCTAEPTQWYKQNESFVKYYALVANIILRYVPGLVTIVNNVIIGTYLGIYAKRREDLLANKSSGGGNLNQSKTAVMLLILSLCLVSSLVPPSVAILLLRFSPEDYEEGGSQYYMYAFLVDMALCLRVMSAANDFFIHIMLVKSSRRLIKKILIDTCCLSCKTSVPPPGPSHQPVDSDRGLASEPTKVKLS